MNYIDLHTHSNMSDGTLPPHDLVLLAIESGLSAIALTDHDTVSGIEEAITAADYLASAGKPFELIPGTEISAAYGKGDIHILGLYIDHKNDILLQTLNKVLNEREERNLKMIKRFNDAGIPIALSDLTKDEPDTVVTRAHFARYLVENRYVKDNNEAFSRYLGSHSSFYVNRSYMTPEHAIALIKKAGGIPVLAHPLLYGLTLEQIDELTCRLKEAGLMGIEAIYSTNSNMDEGIIRRYANKYSLLVTGGSDFHGANKPHIQIGIGKGNLKIPYTLLQKLKSFL